jgi:hypothetical protein
LYYACHPDYSANAKGDLWSPFAEAEKAAGLTVELGVHFLVVCFVLAGWDYYSWCPGRYASIDALTINFSAPSVGRGAMHTHSGMGYWILSNDESSIDSSKALGISHQAVDTQCNTGTSKAKNLNPYWLTGFVDAEGCFTIIVRILSPLKWKVGASFEINLHSDDIAILQRIQAFFG